MLRKSYNQLTIIAEKADGTFIPETMLDRFSDCTFDTIYPAGLFGPAGIFLEQDIRERLLLEGAHRLFIFNGTQQVWEGAIDNIVGSRYGNNIQGVGPWGYYLENRKVNKAWVDDRITDEVWPISDNVDTSTKFRVDRSNRIRLIPEQAAFAPNQYIAVRRTLATGQTIKRVVFNYDFNEYGIITAAAALFNDDADGANTYTDQTNAVDNDTTTGDTFTLTTDDYWYIKRPEGLQLYNGLRVSLGASVNNNAATLTVQRYTKKHRRITPLSVLHDNGGVFSTLTNTFDNNAGTSSTVTITKDDFIYIRVPEARISGFEFDLGATVNAVEASMRVQKYEGSNWREIEAKEQGTRVKATNDMKPLAQDGAHRFAEDEETSAVSVNGTSGFWFRLTFSADLTASIVINEIYALTGWEDLTITDGTASGGAPFAVTGDITWTDPEDLLETKVNNESGYWYRVKTSANLDAVTVNEVQFLDRMSWQWRLRDTIGGSNLFSVTANGSGSQDITLGTPRQYLELQLVFTGSTTARIPPANGSVYGEVSGLKVYSETGNINAYEVTIDAGNLATEISTDTTGLDSTATADLAPNFITTGPESLGSIIARAAGFGNASGGVLAYGLLSSQLASDEKPMLFLADWPSIADPLEYDLEVSIRTAKVPDIRRDYSSIQNWVIVQYTDAEGREHYLTPDDDASLTDADSVADWGRRESPVLNIGQADQTTALAYGVRYLAAHKDPLISASGPIVAVDYVNHRIGFPIPASEVQAGQRLKIVDIEGGIVGVITSTRYQHASREVAITLGFSDNLAILLARGLLVPGNGAMIL